MKTDAEFRSIEDLSNMVVTHEGEAPVLLRDVGRVEDGVEDRRSLVHFDREDTVAIAVIKQSDANTVDVANETFKRLEEIRALLPPGIRLSEREAFLDFSDSIIESVAETQFALLFGGLLAIFVVFVFLRRSRPTFIISLAIPLSMVGTFGLIWLADNTLNTMTLLAMTLAIGVVIDDAIIVLENIERHREGGKDARTAASDGTREITFAAAAATFSVAAVFLPVVFAEGFVGAFLGEFGYTVAAAVVLSLFVALTITPMLAARMPPPQPRKPGSIYDRLEKGFEALEASYRSALDWSLRHRTVTIVLAIASFLLSVGMGVQLGSEFFPPSDGGMVFVQFEAPPGSSLEHTAQFLAKNEEVVIAVPETVGVFAAVGYSSSASVGRPNAGNLNVNLGTANTRERSSFEIMRQFRSELAEIPGQKVQVADPFGSMNSSKADFEVLIRGALSLAELEKLGKQMVAELSTHAGFVDLDSELDLGLPELRVVPDREKAAELGVDARAIAEVVQVMIGGLDVGTFKEGGQRHDIRMRLESEDRRHPEAIDELYVRARDGEVVELRNLVELVPSAAPSQINRTNRQRSVTVLGNLDGIDLGQAMLIANEVADEILPEGASLMTTGAAEAMQESFGQFALMLGLAVLAIYMVLASQFESFLMPLSVMAALPFSLVGAFGGLLAGHLLGMSGMTFNMFSLIGIVLLVGLVTKNSILLVDYANQPAAGGDGEGGGHARGSARPHAPGADDGLLDDLRRAAGRDRARARLGIACADGHRDRGRHVLVDAAHAADRARALPRTRRRRRVAERARCEAFRRPRPRAHQPPRRETLDARRALRLRRRLHLVALRGHRGSRARGRRRPEAARRGDLRPL